MILQNNLKHILLLWQNFFLWMAALYSWKYIILFEHILLIIPKDWAMYLYVNPLENTKSSSG